MLKESKMAVSLDFYLQPSINIYMCASYTAQYICMLSLQYIWISSGLSRCLVPTPGLTSEYPTCSVCVCAYTHTHNTYTSTPCKKWGDTPIVQKNPSRWKQTPTVDQLAKPCSPLFYIRMQWFLTHLWIAPKTPVEHTYAKRRWPPQNESKRWLKRQARRRGAENWCKRRWSCTSPFRRQQAGTSSSS